MVVRDQGEVGVGRDPVLGAGESSTFWNWMEVAALQRCQRSKCH